MLAITQDIHSYSESCALSQLQGQKSSGVSGEDEGKATNRWG